MHQALPAGVPIDTKVPIPTPVSSIPVVPTIPTVPSMVPGTPMVAAISGGIKKKKTYRKRKTSEDDDDFVPTGDEGGSSSSSEISSDADADPEEEPEISSDDEPIDVIPGETIVHPKTTYQFFQKCVRRQVEEDHPSAPPSQIRSIMTKMWRNLTPDERDRYKSEHYKSKSKRTRPRQHRTRTNYAQQPPRPQYGFPAPRMAGLPLNVQMQLHMQNIRNVPRVVPGMRYFPGLRAPLIPGRPINGIPGMPPFQGIPGNFPRGAVDFQGNFQRMQGMPQGMSQGVPQGIPQRVPSMQRVSLPNTAPVERGANVPSVQELQAPQQFQGAPQQLPIQSNPQYQRIQSMQPSIHPQHLQQQVQLQLQPPHKQSPLPQQSPQQGQQQDDLSQQEHSLQQPQMQINQQIFARQPSFPGSQSGAPPFTVPQQLPVQQVQQPIPPQLSPQQLQYQQMRQYQFQLQLQKQQLQRRRQQQLQQQQLLQQQRDALSIHTKTTKTSNDSAHQSANRPQGQQLQDQHEVDQKVPQQSGRPHRAHAGEKLAAFTAELRKTEAEELAEDEAEASSHAASRKRRREHTQEPKRKFVAFPNGDSTIPQPSFAQPAENPQTTAALPWGYPNQTPAQTSPIPPVPASSVITGSSSPSSVPTAVPAPPPLSTQDAFQRDQSFDAF